MNPSEFGIAVPREAYYPPPLSLPNGMKQTTIRQIQYGNINNSNGTAASTEIQIIIPQLDSCFLDPSTTFLDVDGQFTFVWTIGAGSIFVLAPSNSNGGVIGSGASIFRNYQLYLNNAIISDDISEFGLTTYVSLLLGLSEGQRKAMHQMLGLHPTHPGGVWGMPFHGNEFYHRATMSVAGAVYGTQQNTILTAAPTGGFFTPMDGLFFGAPGTTNPTTITLTCTQDVNWNLQIPGLIGSGNDKLFPMFNGPTRIVLTMDQFTSYCAVDFPLAPGAASALYASNTPSQAYFTLNTVHFVGDYVRCDPASFNAIMSALEISNTFIIKSTAATVAASQLPGSSGTVDLLCPPRRASIKCIYFLFQPTSYVGTAPTLADSTLAQIPKWGKYGSINPNLTNGTCITLNGQNYPQQTIDPMNRPVECYTNLLKCLQTWSNDAVKPALQFSSFAVCDSDVNTPVNSTTFTQTTSLIKADSSNGARSLWRVAETTTFRKAAAKDGAYGWARLSKAAGVYPIPAYPSIATLYMTDGTTATDFISVTNNTGPATTVIPANRAFSLTDKSSGIFGSKIASFANQLPFSAGHGVVYYEGTSSCDQSAMGGKWNICADTGVAHAPWQNQFILGFDLDNMARKDYLSGTSTLTGSFFLRMSILSALKFNYNVTMIVWFDMITMLNIAYRQAEVKL